MSSALTGADTRERILAAAVGRIASEGIDGVRIARIAMDAGVSSSLVHYHFDTREELLAQALAWSYEHVGMQRSDIEQDAGATHAQRLGRIIDQCLPLTDELREDWVVWMELWLRAVRHPELQPVADGLYARLHNWFADEIAAGIADGEFAECDATAVADRTLSLCDGLGVRYVIGDRTITLPVARELVTASLARDLRIGQDQLDTMMSVT